MSESKSTELHLDLCPQRTAHLLEALSLIKENFNLVDEILSAGLKNICNRSINENGDVLETGDSFQENHEEHDDKDGEATGENYQDEKEKHRQCCCMCTLRLVSSTKKQQIISKLPVSGSGKSTLERNSAKKRTGKPRLNRTASLRRESAAERRGSTVAVLAVTPTPQTQR